MNSNLLILPAIVPFVFALVMLWLRGREGAARYLALLSGVIQSIVAALLFKLVLSEGTQTLEIGGWEAPFGITFVADLLSASLALVTSFVSLAIALYISVEKDEPITHPFTLPLLQLLLSSVYGAFLTGDLFNLFVWFEVMLITSFVLLSFGDAKQAIGGAIKYVLLNLVSSVLFLTAIGLLYGKTGTLNFAHIAARVGHLSNEPLLIGAATLLFCAFSIKAALFPVHFWLPASYHHTPAFVSATFGGLLTKVGVYAMIRTFTLVFPLQGTWLQTALWIISIATMLFGVLGAASQMNFRRILSFHIISQIGYMTLGLALWSPLALSAAVFYLLHHIIAKTNLFLFGGLAARLCGSDDLRKQGGLYSSHLPTAILFLIPALSLAGMPPLSGFFAKLLVLQAALEAHSLISVICMLLVGLATMYSMIKIWSEAFWKPAPADAVRPSNRTPSAGAYLGVAYLALFTVFIGVGAGYVFPICERIAGELLDQGCYIHAVLGER
ncbi:MAG: Na+/H+ antiporter subunit D [Candidatus Omnitrophica bacterium]|nr:Na+/H+ antiporter subunit D [Candidatus Omnitrophota bacterium]